MRLIIVSMFLLTSVCCYAQKQYTDLHIKDVRSKYNKISSMLPESKVDKYQFAFKEYYIEHNGDTVYEDNGYVREIYVYSFKNKVIRISESWTNTKRYLTKNTKEFNVFNDTLMFVYISNKTQDYILDEPLGYYIEISEDRIYYKDESPYYHLSRHFEGYTTQLDSLYKNVKQEESDIKNDDSYKDLYKEILDNYKKKKMDTYIKEN